MPGPKGNNHAKGNSGKPLKYETPEAMQEAIDDYFEDNDTPTLSGLALHLGFQSRQSLYNYEKRDEFLDIIKNARLRVEAAYERQLVWEGRNSGTIFALKNMGWKDQKEFDHTTGGQQFQGFAYIPPEDSDE